LEAQLISENFQAELKESLFRHAESECQNEHHEAAKRNEIERLSDPMLLVQLRSLKAQYSAYLGDVFLDHAKAEGLDIRYPKHFIDVIGVLQDWSIIVKEEQ